MSTTHVVICACGRWNKYTAQSAGAFKCGKCGKCLTPPPDSGTRLPRGLILKRVVIVVVTAIILGLSTVPFFYDPPPPQRRADRPPVTKPSELAETKIPSSLPPNVRVGDELPYNIPSFAASVQRPVEPIPCFGTSASECNSKPECEWSAPVCFMVKGKPKSLSCPNPNSGFCAPRRSGVKPNEQAAAVAPSAASPSAPGLTEERAPSTGPIERSLRKNAIAQFRIETEVGANYLIKLVSVANAKDQIWIFVRGGETYATKVPLGRYQLRAATGATWYGRKDLFGPSTGFFRMKAKGAGSDANILNFYSQGRTIYGMTISLKKVVDGNMEQEAMTRGDFDAN